MEIKTKVYKFNELSKEVQEKLIEEETCYQFDAYCASCLESDMTWEAEKLIKKYFNIQADPKVYYDLSYSQGSGSMIEFTINFEDLNKKYKILNDEETRFINDKNIINNIEIYHNNNLYYHEYTFDIKYYDDFGCYDYEDIKDEYNITKEDFDKIEDKIIALLYTHDKHYTKSPFIDDIINMNKELTKFGYKILEDGETFKQQAIDWLKDNDTLYFENGKAFTEGYEVI